MSPAFPLDERLGWKGRTAIALFTLHAFLLFFPPIPPDIKGSLWSYLLGYGAIVLAAFELAPRASSLARRWQALTPARRIAVGLGGSTFVFLAGLALRHVAPGTFVRWALEDGVFEPLTILAYFTGGITLIAVGRELAGADRRHLYFLGGCFLVLVLEEIDYLGVAGGIIGRINGVYVGAPHDLINLAVEGLLAPWMIALGVGVVTILAAAFWWRGYLQPARLTRTVFSPSGLWLLGWAGYMALATAADAHVWAPLGPPNAEELFEVAGSILLLCLGLDVAASLVKREERGERVAERGPLADGAGTKNPSEVAKAG